MTKSAFTEGLLPTLLNHHGAIQGLWGPGLYSYNYCIDYFKTNFCVKSTILKISKTPKLKDLSL